MAFAGNCGFDVDLLFGGDKVTTKDVLQMLFAEELGFVFQVATGQHAADVETIFSSLDVPLMKLGKVTTDGVIKVNINGENVLKDEMVDLRACNPECVAQEQLSLQVTPERQLSTRGRHRVVVLREEGGNGEREMFAAFHHAGFEVWDVTMPDLVQMRMVLDRRFRGVAFVGGFTFADLLWSAKGWAGVFKFQPEVLAQFAAFKARDDTLSFVACNGCQFMTMLGWVTHLDTQALESEIQTSSAHRFVHNESGRHESRFVTVQIQASNAVMLRGMAGTCIGVWVSHVECRAHFSHAKMQETYLATGAATIRYVDESNHPTEAYPFNMNGSSHGIAVLVSTDGRHLCFMPHPERCFLKEIVYEKISLQVTMSDSDNQPQTAELRLRVPLDYGTSMEEVQERWDYVIVFPNPPKHVIEVSDERDTIIKRLLGTGLQLRLFYSTGKTLVFCKIRAPEELMRREAESLKMHLQLDSAELRRASFNGIPEYGIAPFPIRDAKQSYRYSPFDYIFAPYFQAGDLQHFYAKKGPNDSLFSSTDRISLIEHIITNHHTGAGQDIDRLIYEGIIVDTYPLHEEQEKMDLKKRWIIWNTSPMNQPFDQICQYFGVKVALYFLYLGHYTKWLLYPTLVGIVTGIVSYSIPSDDYKTVFAYISPLYGAFMTIWMTVYLENWKRLSSRETLRWGTAQYSETVNLRPQFYGERIPSPIDGKSTRYFPTRERLKRVAYSWVVISFLILIVFVLVSSIFMLTYDLTKGSDSNMLVFDNYKYGSIVSSLANVVQITIMTKIYYYVSIVLVDQENHRTDTEYENSLIIKTVIFQFVNNYAGLFYVAFLKEGIEGCDVSCMHELEYMLGIVFFSRLVVGNITEIAVPRFFVYFRKYTLLGHLDVDKQSDAERQLFMAQYDWRGTFDDYTEMALQFGFTTMFVVAFPFAPLLSYVNNYMEIRLDAYRLLFECRRPRPRNVRSMGYWYLVLQAFAAISVCTNAAVVIFTGDFLNDLEMYIRVWIFSIFIGSMFLFKYFLEVCVDDVPEDVTVQKYRQEFLISKCLYHMPDDDVNCPIGDNCDKPENVFTIYDEDS
ncbi:hypothetical protein PsorP6_000032 [Peronosclerospora sorghi]|uniref:Uncharacterized protein n=1 Tax=Peronosclerospora sorghi TaxID=230839 RepID=A0ACC0WRH5_9STRA|nr:hypothetical protein PsorP6_000032 [Peronosclerospora sorghi]